jgi:hypothetical protein
MAFTLDQFRQQNPEYADVPNGQLAYGIWNKHYKDKVPMGIFADQVGLGDTDFQAMIDYSKSEGYTPTARTVAEDYVPEGARAEAYLQGATFGWGDEAVSGVLAAKDKVIGAFEGKDVDFGKAFDTYQQRQYQMLEDYRKNRPVEATMMEIGGAIGSPAMLAKAPAILEKTTPTVRAALTSGAAGTTYAAGTAEEGKRLEAAQNAVLPSMLFGAGTQKVLSGVSTAFQNASRAYNRKPGLESLKKMKSEAYDAVDQSGALIGPPALQKFKMNASKVAADLDFDPDVNKSVVQVQNLIEKKQGTGMTLGQVEKMRRKLWDIHKGAKPDEQVIIRGIIDEVDNMIDDLPTSLPGDLIKNAREANSIYKKSETLINAFEEANKKGGNVVRNYKKAAENVLKRHGKWFTPEERATLEKFATSKWSDSFVGWASKLAPSNNGILLAIHGFGIYSNPGILAATAATQAAKAIESQRSRVGAQKILDVVQGKQPIQAQYVPGVAPVVGMMSGGM